MTAPKTAEVRDLLNYLAKYEATPPTLADGEAHNLTLTADGKLRTDDPTTQAKIDDIEAKLDNATHGLAALKTLIDTAQADLDNPDQYKANVSALALEATLTAIKGAGWTTETLKAIKDAIAAITTERGTNNAMLAASYVTERGTNNAALAAVCTEARLSKLDATITSRQATAVTYYYSGSLANAAEYTPAAGTIISVAYINVEVTAIAKWVLYDTGNNITLVDSYLQSLVSLHNSILGPIYCDGSRIVFQNMSGSANIICLYGFS